MIILRCSKARWPAVAIFLISQVFVSLHLHAKKASARVPDKKPAPEAPVVVRDDYKKGHEMATELRCLEDVEPLLWNYFAKESSIQWLDLAKGIEHKFQQDFEIEKNERVADHKSKLLALQKIYIDLDRKVADLSVELIQKANELEQLEVNPDRTIAAYEKLSSELGNLYALNYSRLGEMALWLKLQAQTVSEVLEDVYSVDPKNRYMPQEGLVLFDQSVALPGLNYEDQLRRTYKNAKDVSFAWTVSQARIYRLALLDMYNRQIPHMRRQLIDLAKLYEKAAYENDETLFRVKLNPFILPKNEFSTEEELKELAFNLRRYLSQNDFLKSCTSQVALEKEVLVKQKELRKIAPLNPWEVPASVEQDLGQVFFEKLSCENIFESQLQTWTSQVLHSPLSSVAIALQLDKALQAKLQNKEKDESALIKKLQSLLSSAQETDSSFRKIYLDFLRHRNPQTLKSMENLVRDLQLQVRLLPRDSLRLKRLLRELYSSADSDLLSGVKSLIANYKTSSMSMEDQSSLSPWLRHEVFEFLTHLNQYNLALQEGISQLHTRKTPQLIGVDLAMLKSWVDQLKQVQKLKNWMPVDGKTLKEHVSAISRVLKSSLKDAGYLRDCTNSLEEYSAQFHFDLKAQVLELKKNEFQKIIYASLVADPSCHQVVDGTAGATSLSAINQSEPISRSIKINGERRKINVSPDYPYFAANSFLQALCVDWKLKAEQALVKHPQNEKYKKLPEWKKEHPYLRPIYGNSSESRIADALAVENNLRFPEHACAYCKKVDVEAYSKSGLQNLVPNASLVYSVLQKENKGRNLLTEEDEASVSGKSEWNKETGLPHSSSTALGTDGDFRASHNKTTQYPYAMQLLSDYVKKIRVLVKDRTPLGVKRFQNFCGSKFFFEEYRAYDPQGQLDKIVNQKVKGKTCDQYIDEGASSYMEGNVTACYNRVLTFCSSYAFAQTMISARAVRFHHGPMGGEQGVKSSCSKLFEDIYAAVELEKSKGERSLCSLVDTVED